MVPRRSSRAVALGGLLAAALPLVAGCGSGQGAATYDEHATPWVANADAGTMAVRAVRVVVDDSGMTTGSTQAYLTFAVVNRGTSTDSLSNATVEGGTVKPSSGATTSLSIPPQGSVVFGASSSGSTPTLRISGLAQPPVPGTTLPVSLTFQSAGSVSVDAPVTTLSASGSTATAQPVQTTGSYPTPSESATAIEP